MAVNAWLMGEQLGQLGFCPRTWVLWENNSPCAYSPTISFYSMRPKCNVLQTPGTLWFFSFSEYLLGQCSIEEGSLIRKGLGSHLVLDNVSNKVTNIKWLAQSKWWKLEREPTCADTKLLFHLPVWLFMFTSWHLSALFITHRKYNLSYFLIGLMWMYTRDYFPHI